MADGIGEARSLARAWAPDFYLSALLAPEPAQTSLVVVAAFLGDVERIVATISDPALAEIRLQWWRDSIAGADRTVRTGHPVADALGEAIRVHSIPLAAFDDLLAARSFDLYADPLLSEAALAAYLDMSDGRAFGLAATCLAGLHQPGPAVSPLISAAGRAYGLTRLIRNLPMFLARGRAPFPACTNGDASALAAVVADRSGQARDALAQARKAWRTASARERAACLPLAVVEAYLGACRRSGHDPTRMIAGIQPLTRVWRLWIVHATGRL